MSAGAASRERLSGPFLRYQKASAGTGSGSFARVGGPPDLVAYSATPTSRLQASWNRANGIARLGS